MNASLNQRTDTRCLSDKGDNMRTTVFSYKNYFNNILNSFLIPKSVMTSRGQCVKPLPKPTEIVVEILNVNIYDWFMKSVSTINGLLFFYIYLELYLLKNFLKEIQTWIQLKSSSLTYWYRMFLTEVFCVFVMAQKTIYRFICEFLCREFPCWEFWYIFNVNYL